MPYMVTFTINIPQMLACIPYMDPMGNGSISYLLIQFFSADGCQICQLHDVLFMFTRIYGVDGLKGKIPLEWMIWGYPHFRKPPYEDLTHDHDCQTLCLSYMKNDLLCLDLYW